MKNTMVKLSGALAFALLIGCGGPAIRGFVVMPDGSQLKNTDVVVYSKPWTDSVKVDEKGEFKLSKGIDVRNEYKLIAEDKDGNMGFVKGYKLSENLEKKIVIKLSRETPAKDAVIEGDVYEQGDTGPGEKIFRGSQ